MGFFGSDVDAVLTVFVVKGTAPGVVNMSQVHPISDVVRVPFSDSRADPERTDPSGARPQSGAGPHSSRL